MSLESEKERLRELALKTEAHDLGREEAARVRKAIVSALSTRSMDRYGAPSFASVADRDLFLIRVREAFTREFNRSLGKEVS